MTKLFLPVRIHVTETGQYAGCFDRACSKAMAEASRKLGIDEYGNSSVVPGWKRSECHIEVVLVELKMIMSMAGVEYCYIFDATPKHTEE